MLGFVHDKQALDHCPHPQKELIFKINSVAMSIEICHFQENNIIMKVYVISPL